MAEELTVQVSKLDDKGRRLVVVIFGGRKYENKFDCDVAYLRRQWREEAISRLRIRGTYTAEGDSNAAVHEELDELLQAAVDAADADPKGSLWQPASVNMAEVEHLATKWAWEQRFPAGTLSNLSGDPGLGKSQVTCDLGSRATRGWPMPPLTGPEGTFKPRGVLYMNAEDDPARTLRPRLEASGADLKRVRFLRSMKCVLSEEGERPVTLPSDIGAVEEVIRECDAAWVFLDPWTAFLDGKLNVNNDADVRRCLSQLATLAENTGAAIVLVRHLNKKSGLSAVYRGGGSIAVTGAARAEHMVGVDPADPESRILACVKSNLAPEPTSLRFHIESVGDTSRVSWGDHCDTTAHDLCSTGSDKRGGGKSDAARTIIEDMLAHGPMASADVLQACLDAGVSKRTYLRVKGEMNVKSHKNGFGDDGTWMVSLPTAGFYGGGF